MPSAGNHSGFHFVCLNSVGNRAWARSIKKDQEEVDEPTIHY